MVAEPWILKLGNQVSTNLKHALSHENSSKKQGSSQDRQSIGILSFEVANLMSKIIHLHKSLTDTEVFKLRNEILKSDGVKALISSDENQLLELTFAEKLDDLNRVASVVSRLGKKCTIPALQGFEHVYGDIVSGIIDVKELGFLVKDMERMVRKMERYVSSTASLYTEMEVMNELEVATKKFQQNQLEESRKVFEQKLAWQRQDVRHLMDISLWNRTYDKVVELLARTVCTIYARLYMMLEDVHLVGEKSLASVSGSQVGYGGASRRVKLNSVPKSGHLDVGDSIRRGANLARGVSLKNDGKNLSGPIVKEGLGKRTLSLRPKVGSQKNEGASYRQDDLNFVCGSGPGRMLMECLSLSSSASKVNDEDDRSNSEDGSSQISTCFSSASGVTKEHQPNLSGCFIHALHRDPSGRDPRQRSSAASSKYGPKSRLLVHAPSHTVGGSALALHYANIIIVLEKLLRYPHLVGDEARDDLYKMLPTSLRKTLKRNLKSYVKDLAMAIYDAPLAHAWRERLDAMLRWLAPLAHNMIRWQSERNFEQHQIVTRTNVLLLQTLYLADREKTETAICELLLGLNYICRYEQQQNALLDCASSFDYEDCVEWQLQFGASFRN